MSDTVFPAAPLPADFADAAYNLLLASTCRRWRRLAKSNVATLLLQENRAVSCADLTAAVECFPNLTHLHLSDGSAESSLDDAFLARLAACCPRLTAFHLGKWIVQRPQHDEAEDHLTPDGLDAFFRQCTRLEHLSLVGLDAHFELPSSIFQLVHLRSLALADLSPLTSEQVHAFSSLTALSISTLVWYYEDLKCLAQLPSLTCLSVPGPYSGVVETPDFAFAHLSSLKSLRLKTVRLVPFDLMFPPHSRCSLLERLTLCNYDELSNLPDDIGDQLPCLRELTISACQHFSERSEQLTCLTRLRSLTLSSCAFDGLPNTFGDMPDLKTLVLHQLGVSFRFPDACNQLISLETLVVTASLVNSPELLGVLTTLKTLCIDCSPILPENIGNLVNLETMFLKSYGPRLPSSFTALTSLTRLELQECGLAQLPEAMGELDCLQELYVVGCSQIEALPESVSKLLRLETLVVDGCSSLSSVPQNLINLTKLKQLELIGCDKLRRAPGSLPCSLESLSLGDSYQVINLPRTYTLPSLKRVSMNRVMSPSALSRCLSSLQHLHLVLAFEEEFPFRLMDLPCLRTLTLGSTGVMRLPDSTLQELRRLELRLPEVRKIPATIAALRKLTYLEINALRLRSLHDSIGELSRLRTLFLSNCPALTRLPGSITQLSFLRVLQVHNSRISSLPPNFVQLSKLQTLDLRGCEQLEFLPREFEQMKLLDVLNVDGCVSLHDDRGLVHLEGGSKFDRRMYRYR